MAELVEGQASPTGHVWSFRDRRFSSQREAEAAMQEAIDAADRRERDRERREVEQWRAAHAAEQEKFWQEGKDSIDRVLSDIAGPVPDALERDLVSAVTAGDIDAAITAACRLNALEKVREVANRALLAHLAAKP